MRENPRFRPFMPLRAAGSDLSETKTFERNKEQKKSKIFLLTCHSHSALNISGEFICSQVFN